MIESLTALLGEIGLSKDEIEAAERLNTAGQTDDLQRYLRLCRCGLMDELHQSQRRVDNLDYLIRQIKGGA